MAFVGLLLLLALALPGRADIDLERGKIRGLFERFLEGKARSEDLALIKSLTEEIELEPPSYLRFYAKGILQEKRGNFRQALENYLRSIRLKPDYNPSYFRFNELIRKVEGAEDLREALTEVLRERFREPPPVILENPPDRYLFLVEKMSQYLLIFRGRELEDLYPVTTGADWEDKWREGDRRTPEGIYYFTRFIPPHKLPKMYGGTAVVLNYPNPVDRLLGKGGSGIWLHGSDQEGRNNIPFSTRGCVVADNSDLRVITARIKRENTLIAIYKEIPSSLRVDDVRSFLKSWEESWESRDLDAYLSHYSREFVWKRGGFREWKRYKRRVILNKKRIEVRVEDLTVVAFRRGLSPEAEYYVAEFRQTYLSDTYRDRGIKRLYITKEGGKLKILAEEFFREERL